MYVISIVMYYMIYAYIYVTTPFENKLLNLFRGVLLLKSLEV